MTNRTSNAFLDALRRPFGGANDKNNEALDIAEAVSEEEAPPVTTSGPVKSPLREEGVELGKTLLRDGFHPVLIFGTRATGKTTFLTSMLAFFTSMPELRVTLTLGDQLSGSEAGALAHESAEKLFHQQVNEYLSGTAPVLNQDASPFFVPLELRKVGVRSITKVALMESSGELWNISNKRNQVQQLRAEILDIYKNYTKPLSVITVVPYAMSEGYTGGDGRIDEAAEFKMSDASLLQTLQIYQQNRPSGIKDQFFFVLTKWDMHTNKIATEEFVRPSEEFVAELVEKRFPRAYSFFKGMTHEQGAKCTPYSAGLIGGTRILEVPRHLKPLLHQFPYRIWQWIYSNATDGGEIDGSGGRPRGGRFWKFLRELFSWK